MLKLRKILLCNNLYIIIFILVILLTIVRLSIIPKSSYSLKSKTFTGIVTNIIQNDDKLTIYIKNEETVIGTYYLKKKENNIKLGNRITIRGKFKLPNENTTKYLFNYKKYLRRKNIFYLVSIYDYKIINKKQSLYYHLKQNIIKQLDNNSYLYTFILGDKTYLNNNVKRSYQENGISHLFAISGMHISLLVGLINRLLKKLKLNEYKIFKITALILISYLFLVGFSPSILRGVLFYILFEFNNLYYFYITPRNLFLLIISLALVVNPNYIFDVGFQYSYLISFALIMLSNYLNSNNYFYSLIKVSLLSFLVSIPITICNFYQLNLFSIIYNLFYVPLVSLVIFPLSLICIFIKPLRVVYNYLIIFLEYSSIFISKIGIGKIIFKRLPLMIYIIYFLLIIFFILKPKRIFICIFFILLLVHYIMPNFNMKFFLQAIDVSQGDSTLIHIGNKNILLDTGGIRKNDLYFNTINPLLKSLGIKKIDYLILSHGDYDHMGEATNLVENFKVEKVIFNCGEFNDLEQELIKVLNKKKIPYYSCIKELNINDNKLYFLQTKEYDNENDNSNVIYTEINGYKFMFMGDASVTTEKEILNKYNLPDIDVLKVGHHGSKTSSSEEFINETNPKYSVISVGKNNRYGHPNKEVLSNLKQSKIYRTDENGSIMFKIKNNKLKIETCSP